MNRITTLFLASLISISALARDIVPQNKTKDRYYIKVTKTVVSGEEYVSFEKCLHDNSVCDVLGPHQMYSMEALKEARVVEGAQFLASIVGGVTGLGVIIAGGTVGFMGGALLSGGAEVVALLTLPIGTATGLMSGFLVDAHVLKLKNPYTQYKQWAALSKKIREDHDVVVASNIHRDTEIKSEIENIADRLEEVLSKL